MYGLQQYIDQNIPQGAIFSKIIYTPSVIVGGVALVVQDYTQVGAKWIIIHVLILSFPAVVAANITFTDQYGGILFEMKNDPASNGIYCFPYIIERGIINIRTNNADTNFSIGHQYITVKDTKRN